MIASGNIKLSEEVIVYETATIGDSFELPMNRLKAIFKYDDQKLSQGYIIVNEKYLRKYVPLETAGLSTVIDELAEVLKIPRDSFGFNTANKAEGANRIFLKPDKKNYQILPDSYAKDLADGYEVIGAKSIFCKWDTSIDDLKKLGLIELMNIGKPDEDYIFSYPVRIGTLLIDGLEIISSGQRGDYPIKTFYRKINNTKNTENSFFEGFASLKQGAHKRSKQTEQITKNRLYVEISIMDIIYKLTYTFSGQHDLELGHSTLLIENNRVYYDRLRMFNQFNTTLPTTCHFFKEEVSIYNRLHNNQLIGITPKGLWINQNTNATIWVDEDLAIIGFSQKEYSYIFELGQIHSFSIVNTRPAIGSGSAGLSVVFTEDKEVVKSWLVFKGKFQSFDKSIAILEAMSGKPVQIAPEWVDD